MLTLSLPHHTRRPASARFSSSPPPPPAHRHGHRSQERPSTPAAPALQAQDGPSMAARGWETQGGIRAQSGASKGGASPAPALSSVPVSCLRPQAEQRDCPHGGLAGKLGDPAPAGDDPTWYSSWGTGPLGRRALSPERGLPLPRAALTRPLGADGLPDHKGHGVPQVIAGLGKAPAVTLRAAALSPVIAVNDPLQPGVRSQRSRVGFLPTSGGRRGASTVPNTTHGCWTRPAKVCNQHGPRPQAVHKAGCGRVHSPVRTPAHPRFPAVSNALLILPISPHPFFKHCKDWVEGSWDSGQLGGLGTVSQASTGAEGQRLNSKTCLRPAPCHSSGVQPRQTQGTGPKGRWGSPLVPTATGQGGALPNESAGRKSCRATVVPSPAILTLASQGPPHTYSSTFRSHNW